MSKKQRKREPLLYIHQPEFQSPAGKMQESFSMKQAEKRRLQLLKKREVEQKQEETGNKTKKNRKGLPEEHHEEAPIFGSSNKSDLSSEQVQETIAEYENNRSEEDTRGHRHGFSFRRVKSFKEMTIEEKLHYLAHFPKQLPPVPCLFQMENKAVRGILIEKKDEFVVIRLLDKTESTIPAKEIIEVRMIGLN